MESRNATSAFNAAERAQYDIDGIRLQVPTSSLNAPLRKALETGRFEQTEARAIRRHLRPEDRVLDLGAGTGFLSILAAQTVGAANVMAVEANPAMIAPIRQNLKANGQGEIDLRHGGVVPDTFDQSTVDFFARKAFWAGSTQPRGDEGTPASTTVPALRIGTLLAAHRPTFVVMDVEGGEQELVATRWPQEVRLIVLETHRNQYGAAGIAHVFRSLAEAGMVYMPWGSKGETLVFERLK